MLDTYIAYLYPLPETLLGIRSTHYVYENTERIKTKNTKTLASNDQFYTEVNKTLTSF